MAGVRPAIDFLARRFEAMSEEQQGKCRIQKHLAACGIASRRQAEEMIRAGRVRKNGEVVTRLGTLCDPRKDRIDVDGRPVKSRAKHFYLAVNKPREVVSTVRDRHAERLVTELAPPEVRSLVKPVGRLDKNSEGLMLLSDDGPLIYRLTHPRYHVEKEYLVGVSGRVDAAALKSLVDGIELDDGPASAVTAEFIRRHARGAVLRIVLVQGRKRQIRRMVEALGCRTTFLRRVRIGPIRLGRLAKGQCRHLTTAEVRLLYGATGMKRTTKSGK